MRPTRAGVGLLLSAVICAVIGRLFGTSEMYLLAAMCGAALVLALCFTALSPLALSVSRVTTPNVLRAGTPARVDLSLRNKNRRRTPILRLDDQVAGTPGATLLLAPILPNTTAEIAYRLPTQRRGELQVGPLDLTLSDPLGLTKSKARASAQVRLVIHPELFDLGVLHAIAGHDPTADLQPIRALASGGDEFFALRPYVIGDELKRVHWKASARSGELVVRQEERPRTGRVTVLLDRNDGVFDEAGFDRACDAAVSALYAAWRGDDALRFVTSSTGSVSDIRSRQELDAVDEQLATMTTTSNASLVRTVDELSRVGRGGTLVIISGAGGTDFANAAEQARRSFGVVLPVQSQTSGDLRHGTIAHDTIVHDGIADFADNWRRAVTATGTGAVTPATSAR